MNEEKVKAIAKDYINKNIEGDFDFNDVFIRLCTLEEELERSKRCGFDADELKEIESKFRKYWSISVPKVFPPEGDIVCPGSIILNVYEDDEEVSIFPAL